MDTTPKYIEMCEKAEEMQREWEPQIGDIVVFNDEMLGILIDIDPTKWFKYKLIHFWKGYKAGIYSFDNSTQRLQAIWLPRQDQLQDIMIKYKNPDKPVDLKFCAYYLYLDFYEKWILKEKKGDINCNSMEQLWLAFVMWEKYGKIWDEKRKEWIRKEVNNV